MMLAWYDNATYRAAGLRARRANGAVACKDAGVCAVGPETHRAKAHAALSEQAE